MSKRTLLTSMLILALALSFALPAHAQAETAPSCPAACVTTYVCASQFGGCAVRRICPTPRPDGDPSATPAPTAQPARPTPTHQPAPEVTPQPTARPSNRDDLAAQVIAETNAERARYGLKALAEDPELTRAAQVRAGEISTLFSHTRPDGTSCFTVSSKAFGENIARGHNSVNRVMAAWMSSEGHRANILRASYGSIGVACARIGGVWHWVQLFGR